ncbi:MAG: response regulator transcription factor [Acidobacteriaceae bacterium]
MRILVVDEDRALAGFIRRGLESEGYHAEAVHDLGDARSALERFAYDLVLLDIHMEENGGAQLLRWVKESGLNSLALVLTGRNRVEDRVACFDLGADDCLIKPFSFAELSARVRALLRRTVKPADYSVRYSDLELNRVERKVYRGGRFIDLTTKEFALLEYLMLNAGRTVSRSMILQDVWRIGFDTMTNVVDVYINYIRKPFTPEQVKQSVAPLLASAVKR